MAGTSKDREAAQRLADVAGVSGAFEGASTSMSDLEGVELTILDFKFIPSQYRQGEDFLCIQAKKGKDTIVINTGAQVVMDAFHRLEKDELPLPAKFVKVQGKNRTYWSIQ